jgi:hypothetical protein
MPSFSFVMNQKCDWDCPYCYFRHFRFDNVSLEVYQKHLPYIKKIIDKLGDLVVNIDIQGGEVGLIPVEILEYFFQTLKKPIVVSTNGMFMEKGYHNNPLIKPYIDRIFFHYWDFSGRKTKDYDIKDIPVLRGICHSRVDGLVNFIKGNPDVMFEYVEFEFDIDEPRKMDVDMYNSLYESIQDFDNVSEYAKGIIRGRLNERPDHRNNCRRYNHSILIDLVNAKICLCQRQLDINIPLTEENLLYRLRTFPKDVFDNDHCETCTRLYAGKFQGNVIERALLTRSKL